MDKLPQRKNIRLKEYDYSQAGYYFITICTKDKEFLFWDVGATIGRPINDIALSKAGKIVELGLNRINDIYGKVELDRYVIMPNHIHLIVVLHNESGRSMTAPTISRIIQQFKGTVSKQIGMPIWQKNYYEHIIRNEQEYHKICEYIEYNPLKWIEDEYYA